MKQDNILIIGAGAIGAFYGALLDKAGARVAVTCRSDYDVVKQHGFQIDSTPLGNWTFRPSKVLKKPADYHRTADYVILCTKITDQTDRVALLRDAVSPSTTIVFIQNGIDIEQEIVDAFPDNKIVSGLAFICCNRIQPGVIKHLAYGKLTLGNLPSGISPETQHLVDLFSRSRIEAVAMDDIITGRWIKSVWNAPFNPLSVLSGGLATADILSTQEAFIRDIMEEVCHIAAACGHPLPADIIDINIENTRKMPPYKTSMLLDFEQGRPMETEAILGNIVRAAAKQNIASPNLKALYALMQLRQLSVSKSCHCSAIQP